LPAAFGIARRRAGRGWKGTGLQLRPQLPEEPLQPAHGLDVAGGFPVHTRRARTLVIPHPIPRHQQERGIGHEVEHIIEPTMRIIIGPTVQLGLDLQYSALGPIQGQLRIVGIHRRAPGIPASSTANLLAPFAMCPPLACSDYYRASAPSRAFGRRRAYPDHPAGHWRAGATRNGSRVHLGID